MIRFVEILTSTSSLFRGSPLMEPQAFIATVGVRMLYHFTDTRNLASIRQHGLLSISELRRRGIKPPAPGGNEWSYDADAIKGVDEYVHLCLFDSHPMEFRAREDGRILESVFLQVSTDVLFVPGVLITAEVANKSGVELLQFDSAVDELDWAVVVDQGLDWRDADVKERRKIAKKYEVLIPRGVPVNLIHGL